MVLPLPVFLQIPSRISMGPKLLCGLLSYFCMHLRYAVVVDLCF